MSDDFKRACGKGIGSGGMKCPCCAPSPGKERKKVRKRARKALKVELRDMLSRNIEEDMDEICLEQEFCE